MSTISGGKALNHSHHTHSLLQQPPQAVSPGGNSYTQTYATGRNNQGRRKGHKTSKKPSLADDMSDGAMRNGRRGQTSITHLMNITLPPRPQEYQNWRGTRRGNIYGIGSGHHVSDKARFIHANYRFIVKPNGNYKLQAVDADQNLDWNDVLQILASSTSQDSSCPICLSRPVAPRMAKCGHIFCLPCLIRYMHSTDEDTPLPEKKARWKKCPICWDSVYISETRPVRWFTGQECPPPREGDDVVLRLVMRRPGSTLALPRDCVDGWEKSDDIPWYFAAEVTDYARIMKGSEEYMTQQFDAEIEDLRRQENEDKLMFGEEPEWTRKAVKTVIEAKEKVLGIGNPPILRQPIEKRARREQPKHSSIGNETTEINPYQNDLALVTLESQAQEQNISKLPNLGAPAQSSQNILQPKYQRSNDVPNLETPYFFYQALLHYYLAPLDIRILKSAFGDFASFPSTLLPRVERVSTGHIIDHDLRKRAKYLSHLPYGCEVGFLECNWTDVVVPDVLDKFRDEIEKRRKRNRDKEYQEEKDRLRAEKAEDDARWANSRRRQSIPRSDTFTAADFHPLSSSYGEGASPWPERQGSGLATLASLSTSPSGPKTVWGTALVAPADEPQRGHEAEGDDGWLASWEQELRAEEEELLAQVAATSLNDESGSAPSKAGGKKKKQKKITLMSTTARRAA
ncbi:hypothetical protein B0O99DRAFT_620093 [Bisporella sp. PMI_857]|nr:hypothetical protein B0O99DRAFT_620093 [Bisporella sp. PMI_857]